jgi:hypothetical protein
MDAMPSTRLVPTLFTLLAALSLLLPGCLRRAPLAQVEPRAALQTADPVSIPKAYTDRDLREWATLSVSETRYPFHPLMLRMVLNSLEE